jgi:DNA-binding transcriptional LysR family regulator
MKATFRQLKLFLALADSGSVSGAARIMHVTQPTASMQLRELADSIGLPLFEVIARRVHLTDTGRELARVARVMAGEWDAFEQYVDGINGLTRGKLKVAVVSTAKYFIPRLLGTFCARYPEIEVALEVLNRDGVVRRLEANLDDLCIMSRPPTDIDIHDDIFLPNPLILVAPAGHRLADRRALGFDALRGERFILREQGSGTRMATDEHFRRHKFRPDIRLELGSNEAIKQSVAGGLGLAVVSAHALGERPEQEGVVPLDVTGFPIESNWHIVHRGGARLSPIAAAFRKLLLDQARSFQL